MSKCKFCQGKGEIETSPGAYETCPECGGTCRNEKPEGEKCGHAMFWDPLGIQGWLCTHCEEYPDNHTPDSERWRAADRAKREAGEHT